MQGDKKRGMEEDNKESEYPRRRIKGELILGYLVSAKELRDLCERLELGENDRLEKLTAVGQMEYPLKMATTHTAIFGTTGSGKSVTTKRLALELVKTGVPVTIVDWHDEYVGLMKEVGGRR